MAVDALVEVLGTLSEGGEGDKPAGEAIDEGNMRSSMFMGSS